MYKVLSAAVIISALREIRESVFSDIVCITISPVKQLSPNTSDMEESSLYKLVTCMIDCYYAGANCSAQYRSFLILMLYA